MASRRKPVAPWQAALERGDLVALDRLCAPDVVLHVADNLLPAPPPGLAGVKQLFGALHAAFPDLRLTIQAEGGQGQTRVYTWAARGTHRGPLMRIKATGLPVAFPGRLMIRHDGGRIAEMWMRTSLRAVLPQLGMAPQVAA